LVVLIILFNKKGMDESPFPFCIFEIKIDA
jgi:hypothetical protein